MQYPGCNYDSTFIDIALEHYETAYKPELHFPKVQIQRW